MSQLSFKNQGLEVDYISFNITGLTNPESIAKIASYLSKSFGFNSQIKEKQDKHFQDLVLEENNTFQVRFLRSLRNTAFKIYWDGTTISFSGTNAAQIYKSIQRRHFDWTVFKDYKINLGRFDLFYFRKDKTTDPNDNYLELEKFMEKSCQRVRDKSKRRHASWHRNSKGLILKVGSRTSSNYYRVYKKNGQSGLKFELEIKHKAVQSFQPYLFSNHIQTFEHNLTKHFYFQSFESLTLNAYPMDWLLHWYRIHSNQIQTNPLVTTYITNKNNQNQERLFNLLKLLSFIKNRTKSKVFLDEQVYYLVQAPLQQFIQYVGMDHNNQRHRTKALNMLRDLQTLQPILENFDEREFRSSVNFPYFKIKKEKRAWIITLAIAKQLCEYKYPYQFTDYFIRSENQYHSRVQFFVICAINNYPLKKYLAIQHFVTKFKLSNQKTTQIRKYIIQALQQLIELQLIQSQVKVIKIDGSSHYFDIHQLTTKIIAQSQQIHLQEFIHYKSMFSQIG